MGIIFSNKTIEGSKKVLIMRQIDPYRSTYLRPRRGSTIFYDNMVRHSTLALFFASVFYIAYLHALIPSQDILRSPLIYQFLYIFVNKDDVYDIID